MPNYVFIQNGHLQGSTRPPLGHLPFTHAGSIVTAELVETLHRSFRAWGDAGFSPGALLPQRVYLNAEGSLVLRFDDKQRPAQTTQLTGSAPDVAAWLVLLDKRIATEGVVEAAAFVWSPNDLATALPFVTPVFLPEGLVRYPPVNWVRVARALAALAAAVA